MVAKMHVSRKRNRRYNFPTLRLTFTYEGADVRLVARQTVEMISPPSDPFPVKEEQKGFWYEIRDVKDSILYRRVTQNPIRFAVEVRSDDAKLPLAWQKVSKPEGEFVVLMPDLEKARSLLFFSSPEELGLASGPAKEIARFALTKRPEGKEVI